MLKSPPLLLFVFFLGREAQTTAASNAASPTHVISWEEGDGLGLLQAAARAKRHKSDDETPSSQITAGHEQQIPPNLKETYSGVWKCQTSWWTGAKVLRFDSHGENVTLRTSCEPWQAYFEGPDLHVGNAWGWAVCNVTDGLLLCSSGDVCERIGAADILEADPTREFKQYLGRWKQEEETADDDLLDIELSDEGELTFTHDFDDGTYSGYFQSGDDGYWEANMCKDHRLTPFVLRVKMSKPGSGVLFTSAKYVGTEEWGPTTLRRRPHSGRGQFPVLWVAIPLLTTVFICPMCCFLRRIDGKAMPEDAHKPPKSGTFAANPLAVARGSESAS